MTSYERLKTKALILQIDEGREADLYVHLLTEKKGRLRSLARSAKKATSRIAPKLGIGNEVEVDLIVGRAYTYTSSERIFTVNAQYVPFAHALCEATRKLLAYTHPEPTLYRGLKKALVLLDKRDGWDVIIGYYAFLITTLGYKPHLDSCSKCKAKACSFPILYLQGREVYCSRCQSRGLRINGADWQALFLLFQQHKIVGARKAKLLRVLSLIINDISHEPLHSLPVLLHSFPLS